VRAPLVVAAAVVLLFLSLMLWTTHGHFVAQVSDLYVVAQYARAMAEGHPFQYNPGEAPTTGSTSLLHTAVLAAAHAAGVRGEALIAFAILLGAALFLASVPLVVRVASRLAGQREGALAGALVALGGPVVWGYLYGSDIALFLFLALLLLDRWLGYWAGGSARSLGVATALLALARPEGLPIALLLAALSHGRPGDRPAPGERLWPWLGVAAGLAVLVLQRALTGSWVTTSVAEKALLPNYGPVGTLALASKYGVDVARGLLLGFYPTEAPIGISAGFAPFAFPPLGLLLVVVAAACPPPVQRVSLRAWLVVVALVFAMVGPNVFMGVHFNRYLLWAFPGLLAVAAAGLGIATRLVAREDAGLERALFTSIGGLFLLLGLLSTVRFAAAYAEMAGETWRREVPMADWIRRHLPPGVPIASPATSVEYLTGHRALNLHGVMSAAFLGTRTADREAGMFEALVRLPVAQRPPYLLLTRGGLDGSPLYQALVEGAPLFQTTSLGDDLVLYRARWELLDGGARPVVPAVLAAVASLTLVDGLNVCDAADEAAHGYRFESRLGDIPLGASVEVDAVPPGSERRLADAGRLVVGSERFRVRSTAGRDLVLVKRSHSSVTVRAMRAGGPSAVPVEIAEDGLIVRVSGRPVLRATLPDAPGWNEHVLRLPAAVVGSGSTELELSGRYGSFHYWAYQ